MPTRQPAVAGRFYPSDPITLERTISALLDAAAGATPPAAPGKVAGIIAPHAGYPYSGPVAAHAFAHLRGATPGRVVLMGPSHHFGFDGASIVTSGAFETPFGVLPIDESFAAQLAAETGSAPSDHIHAPEHALEVELPFLQSVLGSVPIVPILFGSPPSAWHAEFGDTLARLLNHDDLVIVSTDLSHYLPNDDAHRIDQSSIDAVLAQDCSTFNSGCASGAYSLCGAMAATAGMACALARGATDWRLLNYRTSGDVCGETSRVVGYAALSFEYPN